MPGHVSRYNDKLNHQITFDTIEVLDASPIAMSISDICAARISLHGITSQKMARVLNELIEKGFVKKAKSKSGRMMYKSTAVMESQGYDISYESE